MGARTSFDRRGAALLALVLLGACLLRVGAVVATPHLALASDPADYDRLARSIESGHGYVKPAGTSVDHSVATAFRPPGFPVFVAAAYALSGGRVGAARVAQALIGTLIVALVALIALKLFGRTEALVAGVLAAVFPPLVVDGMTLLSEPLFVALELAAVLAALHWRTSRKTRWAVASGGLIGLAILTRTPGALLLIPIALAMRDGPWRRLRAYKAPAILIASALVVVVPWTIRNAVQLHAFVPVSTQDGYTLAGTYNETSRAKEGAWIVATLDPAVARLVERNRRLGEAELGARLNAAARRFALDHPGYLATVAVHNALRLMNLGGGDYERQVAEGDYGLNRGWGRILTYGLLPFLVLAVAGAAAGGARRAPPWLWTVPVLLLSTVMVLATNRFRAPIDPFIILLATLGLLAAWRAARSAVTPAT